MSDKKKTLKAAGDFNEYLVEALKDKELAAEYLNQAASDSDYRVFLLALGQVAKAIGFSELAKMTSIERTTLYKMLSQKGNPTPV
jgi:probable addiction module antidote protein